MPSDPSSDPSRNFEPKTNSSIFRINRDVRFSKDKRPYKTDLGTIDQNNTPGSH